MTAAVDQKRLATLAARAALNGITLHHTSGDFVPNLFVVSKWALTREFTNLDDVQDWLDLVTGSKS